MTARKVLVVVSSATVVAASVERELLNSLDGKEEPKGAGLKITVQ